MTSEIKVTDTELAVLEALWRDHPATIRTLADELYPSGGTTHYATVQKLLDRLATKGCVSRSRRGRVNVFEPLVDRPALIRNRLQATANRLCDGELAPLLTFLVDGADLSADDIDVLRRKVRALRPPPDEAPENQR